MNQIKINMLNRLLMDNARAQTLTQPVAFMHEIVDLGRLESEQQILEQWLQEAKDDR